MIGKIALIVLLGLMILGTYYFDPGVDRSIVGQRSKPGVKLKVMTWNIGYADLEEDNRAHNKDIPNIAQVIVDNDPDVIGLQEITGEPQLQMLLRHLNGKYRGAVAPLGDDDRTVAVLVKNQSASFETIKTETGRTAIAAHFQLSDDRPPVTFISVHADTYNSKKRRVFVGDIVDWARSKLNTDRVFIAGDFNLEIDPDKPEDLYTDNAKNDSESYNYLLKYFRDLGKDAGYTAVNNRRIDYIFGPSVDVAGVQESRVVSEAAMGKMDHRPLVVDLTLA
ncbi:MAG TPA: endonuclease/exonuclease/phosphatase family protein [Blastocatellia bacterium]|nr:endonuclease/exonuclease/phosphatase family protein [Blastocatellia bacterium]